jgi:hypothetical protein
MEGILNKLSHQVLGLTAATLLFTLVAACQGSDPPAVQGGGEAGLDDAGAKTEFRLVAKNNSFESRRLVAVADSEINLTLANEDAGVLHNFALYRSRDAKDVLFRGEIVMGIAEEQYMFTAPSPGSYFFRCDAHPDTMTGTFVTR